MTRLIVYGAAFAAVIAATTMTIYSVLTPEWMTYESHTKTGTRLYDRIGLSERCMWIEGRETCSYFPDDKKCAAAGNDGSGDSDQALCSMWKTTAFLMNFAIVLELATLVTFMIVMAGGKQKRESGWRVLVAMLVGVGFLEVLGIGFVTYLFDYDDMFLVPGYKLDWSWYLCTFSTAIMFLVAFGLAVSAYLLPPEDGYEFLNDEAGGGRV